ncbi:hypothetical protein CAEBREN_31645 [Caenorhabditis brenneri]|uniref:non-specific serine/threonine protein kinase n=1 Tax=Caenorhabditis brenneri TaxID=135651 RepID=G0M910_CAEBE|nr:hypothetical protein CAEBREN_31645 [Caenorhabditis brenneri]
MSAVISQYSCTGSIEQIDRENQENQAPAKQGTKDVAESPVESRKRPNSEDDQAPIAKRRSNVQLTIYEPASQSDQKLDYGKNGYLELEEGEIFGGRYQVIKRLGAGSYAAVYMAENMYTKQTVALKIAKCGEYDNLNSTEEIRYTMFVRGSPDCVNLLDEFTVNERDGKHHVLVFEMLGPTLNQILYRSNQKYLTTDRVRKFCRDILRGLDYSHNVCGIIHCDLKPANLMISIDQDEAQQTSFSIDLRDPTCTASLKIGDFGISAFKTDNVTRLVQTCPYRAPEAHVQAEITPAIDLWSVGCVAYQMATQYVLFPCNHDGNVDERLDHLGKISAELGPIPAELYTTTRLNGRIFRKVFGKKKEFQRGMSETPSISVDNILDKSLMTRREAESFCDFLNQLLKLDPKKRLTAKQALRHPFLFETNDKGDASVDFFV